MRLLPEGGPPTELAGGLTEFLDAFDLAFEWLNREDPTRTGGATLAILETCDGVSEEVWTYPPLPSNGQELTARLGFNPANWAGVPGYTTDERKSRLRQRVGATDPSAEEAPWQQIERAVTGQTVPSVDPSVADPVIAPDPEPESESQSAPPEYIPRVEYTPPVENRPPVHHKTKDDRTEPATLYVTARRWILAEVPPAWNDQLSRWCLILSGATLWFALGLFDVSVLAPLLVLVPTLWWRRRNREAQPVETETEDWL